MKKRTKLTKEAYEKSLGLLRRLSTEKGFTASFEDVANYKRVWARDGVIAGLAALASHEPELIETFRVTIDTLSRHQDHTGRIPSNVSLDEARVSYGTTVGRVDATIWFVIGVCQYVLQTDDKKFMMAHAPALSRALFYLECLELNGRGLLYIPQGGDWADEYINHSYVLFDQVLYFLALKSYVEISGDSGAAARAARLKKLIVTNYFPRIEDEESAYVYHPALFERSVAKYRPPLPLSYFSPRSTDNHIANFANALLLMTNIVDNETKEAIVHTVFSQCPATDFPILPAFYPVIEEGSEKWEHLRSNYVFEFKNKPYEYHNAGLWPLVHGFFLAGARGFEADAEEKLYDFAAVLARDQFIFPEYYHGKTFEPAGTKQLGFSAAAFVLAYEAIINQKTIFHFSE